MKFVHLSDLHLGKRVNGYSMLEDQRYILEEILKIVEEEQPDGVLIAGDIYDKPVPPAEAVELFDTLLVRLSGLGTQVFAISGNHDSPERLAFGGRLMDASGVHMAPVYQGEAAYYELEDGWGKVRVYLLPFLKPAQVRRFFPEEEIESYTDALDCALRQAREEIRREGCRSVLVTHQFVTGAQRAESEELSVGGTDNVDASVFDGFRYVALGHLHRPQGCGEERIRYCGTPLKYSFSEAGDQKSVTVAELGEHGELTVRTRPLVPLRDMRQLRGSYEEVASRSFYGGTSWQEDYVHITLTDEEDIPYALAKLRTIYRNLMKLDYDNRRTRENRELEAVCEAERKSSLELFGELYRSQNNQPLSAEQEAYLAGLIERIWEGNA